MVVQELIAKLGFQVDKAGLDKADKGLSSLAKNAALMYGAYAAASKAFGLVVDSVKGAARLESMNAEFEVMLGNAEAAKYLVQQIQAFAAVTPYHTAELTQNVRLMMAFGQSANQALSAVKMLGDVAGSDSERLGLLSLAYAQVMAAGKLQGQDLLQFVNAGFNPLQELSAKTGKSLATLRAEMEKGLISSAMVAEAFQRATGPGGRFFGNMEKQSQTLNGLWSTLTDNFQIMMAELGGQLVPFIKDVLIVLIDLGDEIAGAYRQLGDFFALMFSDGPTAGDIAAYIAAGFQTIADVIMLMGTAIQLFKYLFIRAANEMAAEAWNLVDALAAIPKTGIKGLKALAEVGYKLHGITPGNTKEDTVKYAKEMRTYDTWYQFLGGDEGYEDGVRKAGDAENQGEWDRFIELGNMIGQTKERDPNAKIALTDGILKALEGKGKVVNSTVNVNNTIHAEGTMKDILQEQANSIFGLTFQQTLIAASV